MFKRAKIEDLEPGMQVYYVPYHVAGDSVTPTDFGKDGSEPGFITSINEATGTVFCRYFHPFASEYASRVLRTRANSEGCNPDQLVIYEHSNPSLVRTHYRRIRAETQAELEELVEELGEESQFDFYDGFIGHESDEHI